MSDKRRSFPVQSAGTAPAVASVDVTVLYDPRDGRVLHTHHTIALEGIKRRTPQEQHQSAKESALRLGCKVEGLEILHVPDFHPTGKSYRVDLQTRTLVEHAPKPRELVRPVPRSGSGL